MNYNRMTLQEQITKLEIEIQVNEYWLNDYGICNEVKIRNRKRTLKRQKKELQMLKEQLGF